MQIRRDRASEDRDQDGVPFSEVAVHRSTLEEAYMELTRERSSSAPPSPTRARTQLRRRDDRHHSPVSLPTTRTGEHWCLRREFPSSWSARTPAPH
jgi:hypothetical protein